MNENKFFHSLLLFRAVHLTFSSLKYCPLEVKHASILSTQFFNRGYKLLLRNASKDRLGFLDHLAFCFKVSPAQLMFQRRKQPEITRRKVWFV